MSNVTWYGNRDDKVQSHQFTLSQDKKGLWTGSQKYFCHRDDLSTVMPVNGSAHPIFDWVYLEAVDITGLEGDWVEIDAKYAGVDASTGSSNSDPNNPKFFEQGLRMATLEEPLAANPKYDLLTAQEKHDAVKAATEPVKSKGGEVKQVDTSSWSELKLDLYDRSRKGQEAYLEPTLEFFHRFVAKDMPTDLDDIGKINTPSGAPLIDPVRNWLLTGYNITERAVGTQSTFDIEKVWLLSGRGGWDAELYDDPPEP